MNNKDNFFAKGKIMDAWNNMTPDQKGFLARMVILIGLIMDSLYPLKFNQKTQVHHKDYNHNPVKQVMLLNLRLMPLILKTWAQNLLVLNYLS